MTRAISPLLPIFYSREVAAAKSRGAPLVALESTIITHGMPYPGNLEMALSVENIVRSQGAVPATIAVLDGNLHIGLEEAEIERLAQTQGAMKLSRADLAFAIAERRTGATTVAATMICAQLAGISVFVTGGIGGVHRGAETSFDISADLQELAHTSVAVVCAGVKSILDIGLTLEYLETHGVPVISVGQEGFPAFFTRESGFKADFRLDTAAEQAAFIDTKWQLGSKGGVIVSNPVPAAQAMPKEEIDAITTQALQEADAGGVKGKQVTPFLLSRIKQLTDGRSLATNIALVKHNAQVGTALAIAMQAVVAR